MNDDQTPAEQAGSAIERMLAGLLRRPNRSQRRTGSRGAAGEARRISKAERDRRKVKARMARQSRKANR